MADIKAHPQSMGDNKPEFYEHEQVETDEKREVGDITKEDLANGLVKSRFDTLSITQALWTFRRSWFYTMMLYTAYIMDGYEVSSPRASCSSTRLPISPPPPPPSTAPPPPPPPSTQCTP